VAAADTGKTLSRARVHLRKVGGDSTEIELEVLTDRNGRYRFQDLPAGRYSLLSRRPGFLDASSGDQHGGRFGLVEIAPGEERRVDFALSPGSVISGRIIDDAGEPLAGVQVTAVRFNYSSNGVRLFPANAMPFSGRTDDRGDFRLPGLSPGTYVIAANYQTNVVGESYATTYYPGTRHLSEAHRFRIGLSELATASFTMQTVRQVRVTGQVRSSTGSSLANYRVALRTDATIGSRGAELDSRTGTFILEGVPPGSYVLDVASSSVGMSNPPPTEFASVQLEVGDQDIHGLLITTGLGVTLSGRVIYDGRAPSSTRPGSEQWPRVYAAVVNNNFRRGTLSAYLDNGLISEDGSFTIRGGYSKVLFRTSMPGWNLKSVMLDGVDITDVPYDTARGGTDRLEIIVTDEHQDVQGRVVDAIGRPSNRFVVIVFPSEVKEGTVRGRLLARSWTSNSDGSFEIGNLPPGNYFAAALASAPDDAQYDTDFHQTIKDRATPFQLLPGERVKLELSLIE
jgi:hypothetical protein